MKEGDIKPDIKNLTAAEKGKKVTFAPDVKSASGTSTPSSTPDITKVDDGESDPNANVCPNLDGIIGSLEIYESGAVKMRLDNGILLDVRPFIHPFILT